MQTSMPADVVLQRILARVEDLHRKLDTLIAARSGAHQLTAAQRTFVEALHRVHGCSPITSGELIEVSSLLTTDRTALRDALKALVPELGPHAVGLALRAIVNTGADADGLRLTAPVREKNRRVWCVELVSG